MSAIDYTSLVWAATAGAALIVFGISAVRDCNVPDGFSAKTALRSWFRRQLQRIKQEAK